MATDAETTRDPPAARLQRSCSAARPPDLRPETPDQLGQPVEVRAGFDRALAPAPPAAHRCHMPELGEPRERVAEDRRRVALGLADLVEEEARRELPAHALQERRLGDRPLLLRGDGPRRDQARLAKSPADACRR